MSLFNLFSKPLDFVKEENGAVNHGPLTDKSNYSGETTCNSPLLIESSQAPINQPQHENSRDVQSNSKVPIINKGVGKKKTLPHKQKTKMTKRTYKDYDSIACTEDDVNIHWQKGGVSLDESRTHQPEEVLGVASNCRSVVCYDDSWFEVPKNRNQRRRLRKWKEKAENKLQKVAKKRLSCKTSGNIPRHEGVDGRGMTRGRRKANVNQRDKTVPSKPVQGVQSCVSFNDSPGTSNAKGYRGFQSCDNSLKRKLEDDKNEKTKKIQKIFAEWDDTVLFNEKKLVEREKERIESEYASPKLNKTDTFSKTRLRKIERNRIYREKMKERKLKEATHQQGVQKRVVPCKFYIHGSCNKGNECTFSHDVEQQPKDDVCKFYIISQCMKPESCLYRHGEWPCKFFHTRSCMHGDKCKFSHEPLTDITSKWLQKTLDEDSRDERKAAGEMEQKLMPQPEESTCHFGPSPALPQEVPTNEQTSILQPTDCYKLIPIEAVGCPTSLFTFYREAIEGHRLKEKAMDVFNPIPETRDISKEQPSMSCNFSLHQDGEITLSKCPPTHGVQIQPPVPCHSPQTTPPTTNLEEKPFRLPGLFLTSIKPETPPTSIMEHQPMSENFRPARHAMVSLPTRSSVVERKTVPRPILDSVKLEDGAK